MPVRGSNAHFGARGSALTFTHLFPGGGVSTPATRSQLVMSVHDAWMALHRFIVEHWYERYVGYVETPRTNARRIR